MQTAEDAQAHTTATTQQHSYQQGSVASAATAVGNPLAHAPTPTSTTGAHATHYPSAAHPCDPPCPTPAVSAAAPPSGTTAAAASSVVDNAAADTQPPEPPSPSFLAAQLLSQASPPGTGSAYLLSYERQLVQEMIEEDALCIMSTGMGWQKVVAVLLRLHAHSQPGVVLILGCQPWQKELLCREVKRHDPSIEPPVEINNEVPALQRIELYKTPACCFVTTRILVVDLLSNRVLPRNIAGMIIVNAHRLTDSSGEAFAVRLYRTGNASGFVRAVSDQPTAFTAGFNKVEKIMRTLHVRRLILWPRFQQYVQEELGAHPPEVVEWELDLTGSMLQIQAAITEILDTLIKDLRRTNKIDCSELTLDNGLLRNFDDIVRRQLDPVWHTVSFRTKQICKDLRTLRQMALYLLHYDAVTFLSFLEGLRASEGKGCLWLFHDAAHVLFEMARRRVYIYKHAPAAAPKGAPGVEGAAAGGAAGVEAAPGKAGGGGGRKRKQPGASGSEQAGGPAGRSPQLEVVLEEMPKWQLLVDVLTEVQQQRQQWRQQAEQARRSQTAAAGPVASGVEAAAAGKGAAAGATGDAAEGLAVGLAAADGDTSAGGLGQLDAAALCRLSSAPVLVVAREPHMCAQLEQVVRLGGRVVMQAMFEAYLLTSMRGSALAGAAGGGSETGPASPSGSGAAASGRTGRAQGGRGRGRGRRGSSSGWASVPDLLQRGPALRPGEQQALRQEAERLEDARRAASGLAPVKGKGRGGGVPGRGRGRGGKAGIMGAKRRATEEGEEGGNAEGDDAEGMRELVQGGSSGGGARGRRKKRDDSPPPPLHTAAAAAAAAGGTSQQQPSTSRHAPPITNVSAAPTAATARNLNSNRNLPSAPAPSQGPAGPAAAASTSSASACPLLEGVRFHALESRQDDVLWAVQPSCVILYEPDLAFIRQVEVYQAERQGAPLVVHHLTHAQSVEYKSHVASVERERQAMSSLIEFKSHIVIPVGLKPGHQLSAWTPDPGAGDIFAMNQMTRHGGTAPARTAPRRLVVDVREFMSGLPAVLHQRGFELHPLTLEVGDYVLSPEMCVERKAIPDLHSSLASGRLYHQAEAMSKQYKTPLLLIEFDPDRAFALQAVSELGDDIDSRNIVSRLVLLLLHFPRLRLLWSRSPHATAELFATLKSNQDEPDPATAALVGLPPGTAPGSAASETVVNQPAIDLLRRLPGVTDANFRGLMAAAGSLAGLADLDEEALARAMGGQSFAKQAKALHDFLHTPCPRV